MIIGVDTDILVDFIMKGAPSHPAARRFIGEMVDKLGMVAQNLHELIHVCADARRFENPLSMDEAIRYSRTRWDGNGPNAPGVTRFHVALWSASSVPSIVGNGSDALARIGR